MTYKDEWDTEDVMNEMGYPKNQTDFTYEDITAITHNVLNSYEQKVKEAIMIQINKRPSGNPEVDAYINGIQLMEDLEIRK